MHNPGSVAHPLFFSVPNHFCNNLSSIVTSLRRTNDSRSKQSTSSYRLSIPNRFLHSWLTSLKEDTQAYKVYHSP